MAKFYKRTNNGVVGLCTEYIYRKIEERRELRAECKQHGLPQPELPPVTPIFTFGDVNHRSFRPFLTGSTLDMHELLEGHEVEDGWFWVPFSNGYETGIHGPELQRHEWQFRTTLREAMDAFGLDRKDS